MISKILGFIVVVLLALAGVIALRPGDFRVTRSATIAAPVNVVFAQINDFHNWQGWSPWAKRDPAAKNTFEGNASGAGAIFSWAGNKEVGEGRMTITDSRPFELIRIKLEFLKPFPATNTAEFTFQSAGDQTLVTWSMFGPQPFLGKAISLFLPMDKMVGGDFETGLAQIKAIAEKK